jgi:alpha-D-ribose 1-methylphosphonate 5-triphosphate synthase subunit PhnH
MMRENSFNEVFDSQAAFRALLDALSRPGSVCRLPDCSYKGAPRGFCAPALSILKTLCDHRVSFSVGGGSGDSQWMRYLEANLATPFKGAEEADYVLFDGTRFDEDFALLKRGSAEFPETSATAVLCVGRLAEGVGENAGENTPRSCRLVLTGPGVRERASLTLAGFDHRYTEERGRANRFPPMGIDLFLVDPEGRVAGIPRSSAVETS